MHGRTRYLRSVTGWEKYNKGEVPAVFDVEFTYLKISCFCIANPHENQRGAAEQQNKLWFHLLFLGLPNTGIFFGEGSHALQRLLPAGQVHKHRLVQE